MPRVQWNERYERGECSLQDVIDNGQTSNLVKMCLRYLCLNRDGGKMILRSKGAFYIGSNGKEQPLNDQAATMARYNFAKKVLEHFGYTFTERVAYKGESYWLKIRQYPVNGTLAIIGCSHKYAFTRNHIVITVSEPAQKIPNVGEIFNNRIFHNRAGGLYLGYTVNPFTDSDPDFDVWDEPFHGLKRLDGTIDLAFPI